MYSTYNCFMLNSMYTDAFENIENNQTLQYYENNAEAYYSNTITADMQDARGRFTRHLPSGARVLDFGCCSGRDAGFFKDLGYDVDAMDGSEELCRKASEYLGSPVKHMLFQDFQAEAEYDGIWACASILHLPKDELHTVLNNIAAALKDGGILYTSFKYGTFEGMRIGRYFTYFTDESLKAFWDIPGFEIFETWTSADVRPGREEERWINLLARKSLQ